MKHFITISIAVFLSIIFGLTANAQIFYKIEGKDLKQPSYIFGTHHLAPTSIIDSYPTLKDMVNLTDAVVGEIDMTIPEMQMAMEMQPYMMAPADSTISRLVTPEVFDDLSRKFSLYSPMPGMQLIQFDSLRPIVISAMVTMNVMKQYFPDFDPGNQLDAYFQKKFKKNGKSVIPLETPELQARLLYTFTPLDKQIEDLKELLDNPEKLNENCEKLNKAYLNGDLESLLKLTESEDSDPAFMEALLTLRNRNWLQRLPEIIDEHPVLIVVGALHLAGPEGIVERLRSLGYEVTPVK